MASQRRVKFDKDPEEIWGIRVNFTNSFPIDAEEITAITVTAQKWERKNSATKTSDTSIFQSTAYAITPDKKKVDVFHKEGTHNYDYKIRVKATLDGGTSVLVKSYYIRVRNK